MQCFKMGWSSKERISVKAELPGGVILRRASQLTVLGTKVVVTGEHLRGLP